MYLCKRDVSQECKGDYKDCTDCILDKIRAEIESIERYGMVNGHDIWLRTPEEIKKEVLKIIDKYKAESEDKE